METRANYTLIGAFTLAVLVAAFGFIFWFTRSGTDGERATYEVVFDGSVSGLRPGSAVLFNGIKVGEVSKLRLDPTDPGQAIATIGIEKTIPVRSDTRVTLEYQGLTGISSVALRGGEPNAPALAVPAGQIPTLKADASGMQDIAQGAREIMGRADSILKKVDTFLTENQAGATNIVKNVDRFTTALGENSDELATFMKETSAAAKRIGSMSEKFEALAGEFQKVVSAVSPQKVESLVADASDLARKLSEMTPKLDRILGNVESMTTTEDGQNAFQMVGEAAKSVKQAADNLDKRMADVTSGLSRFSNQGLREWTALATDGRRTLAELERTIKNLDRNPSRVLFGGNSGGNVPQYGR
ncbi:mce related protein [Variibacter gotjawalensis]|uniref:Mce related protein n=1 Tax=Variibacter gotjawalensis TaxID=1333996 RepID=A0A0S3PV55_9BRAD|nr:MlaD family protein [Variibacter gotjawalensis]NIK50020.1 phospholipid/cholesterol/gamma-HCH transport system substrate-binding protein [Variibacter gotjawalensis]RZS46019.1 phospholipid/cholesterol/gamma-HCH transport system substrate-binding protein [Variibacter gotjawalensis]BAT59694.1 mce related protein [Variibacter gotjawalensis]